MKQAVLTIAKPAGPRAATKPGEMRKIAYVPELARYRDGSAVLRDEMRKVELHRDMLKTQLSAVVMRMRLRSDSINDMIKASGAPNQRLPIARRQAHDAASAAALRDQVRAADQRHGTLKAQIAVAERRSLSARQQQRSSPEPTRQAGKAEQLARLRANQEAAATGAWKLLKKTLRQGAK